MATIYDYTVKDRKGADVSLRSYEGEVLLIVNTATKCGFTPQYEELEKLYEHFRGKGFQLLDFPCNQFGQQAPGTDAQIHEFCQLTYGVDFPQFKKIKVKAYMTKRDLKSLVLPLFTIVLGKNFSMTKNLFSLRLSSHH